MREQERHVLAATDLPCQHGTIGPTQCSNTCVCWREAEAHEHEVQHGCECGADHGEDHRHSTCGVCVAREEVKIDLCGRVPVPYASMISPCCAVALNPTLHLLAATIGQDRNAPHSGMRERAQRANWSGRRGTRTKGADRTGPRSPRARGVGEA